MPRSETATTTVSFPTTDLTADDFNPRETKDVDHMKRIDGEPVANGMTMLKLPKATFPAKALSNGHAG